MKRIIEICFDGNWSLIGASEFFIRILMSTSYYFILYLIIYLPFFAVRGEEGVWGDWSQWTGCDSPADYVASRSRKCLTKDTYQPTSVDRCLLIPGKKSDLDIMPCSKYRAMLQQRELEFLETLTESGSYS